eukprot:CAMPEP_0194544684 /NCGR_PEP_ID=MMETSP0253-20130528/87972_1 /TAXON_ID=2966 /ORGANISM="Noctiluca scintillans" /LENGTH=65 /DNA_ID=CAMNT_0039391599 /DNA_START=52 /DNA_END=249 /DNA_ORIENTATION=+
MSEPREAVAQPQRLSDERKRLFSPNLNHTVMEWLKFSDIEDPSTKINHFRDEGLFITPSCEDDDL